MVNWKNRSNTVEKAAQRPSEKFSRDTPSFSWRWLNCDRFAGLVKERSAFCAITGNDLDKLEPAPGQTCFAFSTATVARYASAKAFKGLATFLRGRKRADAGFQFTEVFQPVEKPALQIRRGFRMGGGSHSCCTGANHGSALRCQFAPLRRSGGILRLRSEWHAVCAIIVGRRRSTGFARFG